MKRIRKPILCLLVATFFLLPISAVKSDIKVHIKVISSDESHNVLPTEAQFLMDTDSDCVIVDVRTFEEYSSGHIKGAVSIPFSGCSSCFIEMVEKYLWKTIMIYCKSGIRSQKAAELLSMNGFKDIYCLEGGLDLWKAKRFPVVTFVSRPKVSDNNECLTGCISLDHYYIEEEKMITTRNIPPFWDWRHATHNNVTGDWTTPVKSQGACGSCWDFAAMGALEAVINIRINNPFFNIDLSEQYLLSCPSNSGGCSGWNAYWAYWYILNKDGAIPENCFPYRANDRIPCSEKCNDWRGKLMPIIDFGASRNPDRESLKGLLLDFGPVVTEMAVYGDFGTYEGGVYEHPGDEPTSDINHQVVIIGYNDNPGYWICKNSWGTDWGEEGWFRIAYGDCQIEHYIIYVDFSPAIARIDDSYFGRIGETLVFDGGKSESLTSSIVSYAWDFGDGNTGSGVHSSHVYAREGKFVVRLTVTDENENQGVAKTRVYVDDTPPIVEIMKPKENCFYYYGKEKSYMPFRTVIIGNITIFVTATDVLAGLDRIEFYIDRYLVNISKQESFVWDWSDATFGFHVINIKAYDMIGNVKSVEIKVWTWMEF